MELKNKRSSAPILIGRREAVPYRYKYIQIRCNKESQGFMILMIGRATRKGWQNIPSNRFSQKKYEERIQQIL